MDKYQFVAKISEGAYGTVWKATDKTNGRCVAIKKAKTPPQDEEEAEFAMREVRLLQLISHPNVVELLEAFQSQSGRLYLVFEHMDSTLLALTRAHPQGLPQHAVQSVTWQLLQALACLHRNQIIHRDIKPSNILVNGDGVVKLCDFGFARTTAGHNVSEFTTYVVTRWYRAPEILVGDPRYGPGVDIFALGCIVAEMATGKPLFPGKTHHDQLWLVLKALGGMTEGQLSLLQKDPQFQCFKLPSESQLEPLESKLPKVRGPMLQLIKACLHPDAAQRPSAEQLLRFPFFKGVDLALPPALRAHYKPEDFATDTFTPRTTPTPRPEPSTQSSTARASAAPAAAGEGPAGSPSSPTPTAATAPDLDLSPASGSHQQGQGQGSQPSSSPSLAAVSGAAGALGSSRGKPPLGPTGASHPMGTSPARSRTNSTSSTAAVNSSSYRTTGASLIDDYMDSSCVNNGAAGSKEKETSLGTSPHSRAPEEHGRSDVIFARASTDGVASASYGSPARLPMAIMNHPSFHRLSETGGSGDNASSGISRPGAGATSGTQGSSKRATWHGGSLGFVPPPRPSAHALGNGGAPAALQPHPPLHHHSQSASHAVIGDGPPARRSVSGTGPAAATTQWEATTRQRLSSSSACVGGPARTSSTGSEAALSLGLGVGAAEDGHLSGFLRMTSREHLGRSGGPGSTASDKERTSDPHDRDRNSGGQEGAVGRGTGRLQAGLVPSGVVARHSASGSGSAQEGVGGGSKGVAGAALDKAWQRLQRAANMIHGSESTGDIAGAGAEGGRAAPRGPVPPLRPSADGTGLWHAAGGAGGSLGPVMTARFSNRSAYSSDGHEDIPGLSAYFHRSSHSGTVPTVAPQQAGVAPQQGPNKALLPTLGSAAARADSRSELLGSRTPRTSSTGTPVLTAGPPPAFVLAGGSVDSGCARTRPTSSEKLAQQPQVGNGSLLPAIRSKPLQAAPAGSVGRLEMTGRLGVLHVAGVPAMRTVR